MSNTPDQGFAAYLRDAMRAAGIDPAQRGAGAELARRADLSETQVSRWLRRGDQPDVQSLRKVGRVLHIPIRDLMVAAGYLTAEEAGLSPTDTPPTAEDHIRNDPRLTQRQKEILLATLDEMRARYVPQKQ